ncbi:MAG: hypothetical protein CMI00_06120 [Oceanospirillaceae bacterium]|nr:hypothetical protein [Oceanospirillaceae bacterium]|tara:strand:+ start:68273 stop:69394 length:1122 start_codon:yes stop_codon:yes gene_type:complete
MGSLQHDILRRHAMAALGILLFTLLYLFAYLATFDVGRDISPIYLPVILYVAGHALTVFCVSRGWFDHTRDPSLTLPVMVMAILYMSYLLYLAPELQWLVLISYLNIMPFGIFSLAWRGLLGMTLFVLFCYATVLFSLSFKGQGMAPQVEALSLMALLGSLLMSAFVGREFFLLRTAYQRKNVELRRALGRIEELAVTDELTGLNNRRYLLRTLEKHRAMAIRQNIPFVVAFIDIDHFKQTNDRHGHRIGDQVLGELAQLLQSSIREVDLAARYGGEEFILLLSGLRLSTAKRVMERIRESVEVHTFSDMGLRQTVSIGVAAYMPDEEADEVLSRADRMLYVAKHEGRNLVRVDPTETPETTESGASAGGNNA